MNIEQRTFNTEHRRTSDTTRLGLYPSMLNSAYQGACPCLPVGRYILFIAVMLIFMSSSLSAKELTIPPFTPLSLIVFLPVIHGQIPANQIVVSSKTIPGWKQSWDLARMSARQKDYGVAVAEYQKVLRLKANLTQARWELVILLLQQDRWSEADLHVDRLLEADARNKLYLHVKAVLAQRAGEYRHSLELFKRGAVGGVSKDPLVMSGMANALFALGKEKECLAVLIDLLRHDPEDDRVALDLSVLAFRLGQYELASAHVDDLVSRDGSAPLLLMAARLHEKLNEPRAAMSYWQQLIALRPDNIEACGYLAQYYEGQGADTKAIACLLTLLKQEQHKSIYQKRIALAYLQLEQFDKAEPYFEQYLLENPDDTDSVRAMIKIHAAKGEKDETLTALEHYFSIESKPAKGNLQQAALLYSEGGFFREAIPIYRRLLDMTPNDPKLMWALAKTLLASGQEEDSLVAWRQLAEVAPGAIEVYRPMAKLLEKLGRVRELLEVLTVINKLAPGDQAVIFKIAGLYFGQHDYRRALIFLDKLQGRERQGVDFFRWRGIIWLQKRQYAKALADFEAMLDLDPEREDIRLQCLRLAGLVDNLQAVNRHASYLERANPQLDLFATVIMARAFFDSGDFTRAEEIYRGVVGLLLTKLTPSKRISEISSTPGHIGKAGGLWVSGADKSSYDSNAKDIIFRAFQGLAELLRAEDLSYEAEEVLRQGAALSGDSQFLSELFDVALSRGELTEAGGWLDLLAQDAKGEQWISLIGRARYQVAQGLNFSAQSICQRLSLIIAEQAHLDLGKGGAVLLGDRYPVWVSRSLDLVDLQISLGRYAAASELCRYLLAQDNTILEARVLANTVYQESNGRFGEKFDIQFGDMGPGFLLSYENFCWQRQMFVALERVAAYVKGISAASRRASRFLAASKVKLNKKGEAVSLYEELLRDTPDKEDLLISLAKLYFSMGNVVNSHEILSQITDNALRGDAVLLRARISWLTGDWQESIAIYEEYLQPSVEDQLKGAAEEFGISLPVMEDRRTFLAKIGLVPGTASDLVDKVMVPEFIGLVTEPAQANEDSKNTWTAKGLHKIPAKRKSSALNMREGGERGMFNLAIARLYARFRWQKIFAGELKIRQAVKGREYVLAAKEYELFIKKNPQDVHLLYDLAGVYSRLGRLGEEAALYEQLLGKQVAYPGIQEAMSRNQLKQRPFVSGEYGYLKEDGWQGQKNMRQDWLATDVWYSPGTQKSLKLTVSTINYKSASGDENVRANRLYMAYESAIWQGLTVDIGGGLHQLTDGGEDLFLFRGGLTGKFSDKLAGRVSFIRDVVVDTPSSIIWGITQNRLESGVTVDVVPRLELSGDFFYTDYSDSNWTTGYDLQAAYILFSEPTFLKINYKFNFQNSKDGGAIGIRSSNKFQPGEHPYWAPTNYWQNRFGIFFKHTLGKNILGREAPRYYTAEYYLGHFSDGYPFQTIKLAGFMEFSSSFFAQLSGEITNSQPYLKKELVVTISYRW